MPEEKKQPSEDSSEQYISKLVQRIVNEVTFDENEELDESEEFRLKQKLNRIKQNRNETEFVESVQHDYVFKNIKWPTIGEFNEAIGAEKIDEFIKNVKKNDYFEKKLKKGFIDFTWEFDSCWLYCVDLIEQVEQEFNYLYTYRVCWSIPTRRKPIPRFTANVYFTYTVSKIKPKDKSVDVQYTIETQQLIHKPGHSRFRQQWLSDILELKERLIDDCKF